jgi:hypothetical protein
MGVDVSEHAGVALEQASPILSSVRWCHGAGAEL